MVHTPDVEFIDLGHWRGSKEIRVLAGRDTGEDVRSRAKIDELDKSGRTVEVLVPTDLFAVSSSFFLGLFAKSIRTLGEGDFRTRYRFTGKDIRLVVDDAIRSVLLTEPLR